MESTPQPEALKKIKAAGFEGFETPQFNVQDKGLVKDSGLEFVSMLFPMSVDELKKGVEEANSFGAVLINCHAGKDWWSDEQANDFFEAALKVESQAPVHFETHRGRMLHEPKAAAAILRRFPSLRITADFSHWTCVCESLLGDQEEAMKLAISRTGYIHARVGHEEGPQVPDPRVPQWEGHVAHFEKWWDAIRQEHAARGSDVLRVDVEFGPPNYMWTDPQGGRPLSDLWDVCVWMRDRLRQRWA